MKSPVSYLTDEAYSKLPAVERALHQARSQVGQEEKPRGSNWGGMVTEYIKSTGLNVACFWCAAYVTWCLKQAQYSGKLPKHRASTYYWYVFGKENNILHKTPQRNDLFVWNGANGGHIGWVIRVNGNRFWTLEGNSNNDGSRNGYKVVEHERTIESLKKYPRWGFIRLGELK